jgi:hypothetical protein
VQASRLHSDRLHYGLTRIVRNYFFWKGKTMNTPQSQPPKARPLATTSIEITTPTTNEQVTSPFLTAGLCSLDVTSVTLTLVSSSPQTPEITAIITPSSGTWNHTFTVNAADWPGNTTLTATVTGKPISDQVTFQITG